MITEVAPRHSSPSASDRHPIGHVPDGWQVASLGEVSTPLRETINPGAHQDELFEYYSIPALQQTGEPTITPGRAILSQKLLVPDGAVLFGKLNPRVPKVWQVRSRSLHRKLASTEFLAMTPGPHLLGDFLTFLCWSSHVLGVSKGLVGGSTPSRQRVDPSAFFDIRVPVPPAGEQRAIAATLSTIQAAVEVQNKIVAVLKELKAATVAKLFHEGLRGEPLKQTEIGEMPESWRIELLEDICNAPHGFIQTGPFGSQLHAYDYLREGMPIVNPTHMEGGRIRHTEIPRVSELNARRLERHRLLTGDILFSRRGDVGRHALVSDEENGWLCGTGCLIVRPSYGKVDPSYLAYFLDTQVVQDQLKTNAVGSIMPNINTKILGGTPIAVPGLPEQLEIGKLLSVLDRAIRPAILRHEILRAHFLSMLERLLSGRIRMPFETSTDTGDASEDAKALEHWVSTLIRRFGPERVILFGEWVPGSPKAWDGVGLLVEMPFRGLARDQAARIAREIPHDFSLDLLVRRPEELRRAREIGDRYLGGILERGRVLYARPPGAPARQAAEAEAKAPRRPPQVLSEETLQELVRRIVEAAAPERIVLFGSAARGEMGPDSDVDLLVVKACADRREVARTIRRCLIGVAPGLPKDVIVVTPGELERYRDTIGLIYRPALREGRVVYAA